MQLLHIILVMYNACFKRNNAQQWFRENGGYDGIYRNMDVLYFYHSKGRLQHNGICLVVTCKEVPENNIIVLRF